MYIYIYMYKYAYVYCLGSILGLGSVFPSRWYLCTSGPRSREARGFLVLFLRASGLPSTPPPKAQNNPEALPREVRCT